MAIKTILEEFYMLEAFNSINIIMSGSKHAAYSFFFDQNFVPLSILDKVLNETTFVMCSKE